MEQNKRLEYLYRQFSNNNLREDELAEFLELMVQPSNAAFVSALMDTSWEEVVGDLSRKKKQVERKQILGYAVAASALIAACISAALFYFNGQDGSKTGSVSTKLATKTIEAGGNKAVLTLADGSSILLDTAANGTLSRQNGVSIVKAGGELVYKPEANARENRFNTVTIPSGGRYQLVLSDGTKVWLNSASSLRFPAAFSGDTRTVELQGEGYFEVEHDASRPFIIQAGSAQIKDLGTAFNVSAYTGEPGMTTTVVSGKVALTTGSRETILSPGQEVQLIHSRHVVNMHADVEEAIAWKNGSFIFNDADVKTILQKLARWYDVDIQYHDDLNAMRISGEMPMSLSLQNVMKVLGESGLHLRLEGRKLMVLP